jgi:3-methyladenine DNA glycosylase AlkD
MLISKAIQLTMENIIENIREELLRNIDEKTEATSQHFFKEKIKVYGVKTPLVNKIGKEFFTHIRSLTKSEIFDLCDRLWQSGYIEESIIACNWSYFLHKDYEADDFEVFEQWIADYVNNWASCDTLCNHTVGTFIEMYPGYLKNLKDFTRSDNRWMRRASAVTLIIPARKGKFLNDILEIADRLLLDKDDLVQKGYGWMLKAASEAHQKVIFDYVVRNKAVMPRIALRYAIEKMPAEMKAFAMKK